MVVEKGPSFSSSSGEVEWVFFLHPDKSEADFDNLFMKFLRNMMKAANQNQPATDKSQLLQSDIIGYEQYDWWCLEWQFFCSNDSVQRGRSSGQGHEGRKGLFIMT